MPDESGPDWSRVEQQLPDDYFRRPSPARVWNYWLGGKDNYEPDQTVGEVVADIYPGIRTMASQSRQFLIRSVRHLAGEVGIRQFLDLGSGLPDPIGNNTHSVAQAVAPDAKIVYVDNDPVVLAHQRALMVSGPQGASAYLDEDYRATDEVIARASRTLDFTQPISVMFMGVFGYLPPYDELRSIVSRTMAAVPPGSYLTFWDGTDTSDEIRESHRLQAEMGHPYTLRTVEEIEQVFTGLDLVEPGVVQLSRWRPNENGIAAGRQQVDAFGGVARKA
ncbi:SAM-dependent methyltransferase [Pseudonocardia sp. MH-G8]|uniref:SAM-dependent methyltransferase n=1 Tax=Pseudonocardia sp. MH-G8 TaxID=1854588 RepID=UPI000BA1540E|nr:SAM-dependent methyltransferase [Pseudonocardia sp. MH-G8]OZM82692.1 S-adenosyl methyltransferase [Pseudonocardia sp. MH-G8]